MECLERRMKMENSEDKIILMSIMSYYARQIFSGIKKYEFRISPLKLCDLNKTIYVYSAKVDKAIIGSFVVKNIHKGNINEILKITEYDKRQDRQEIVDYFKNVAVCYALELTDINLFRNPLTLKQMRVFDPNIQLPQYYKYITKKSIIYDKLKQLKPVEN